MAQDFHASLPGVRLARWIVVQDEDRSAAVRSTVRGAFRRPQIPWELVAPALDLKPTDLDEQWWTDTALDGRDACIVLSRPFGL